MKRIAHKCSLTLRHHGRRKDFFQGGGAVGDFSKIFSRRDQKWWNLFLPLEIKKKLFC